jgi:hypothetical protein
MLDAVGESNPTGCSWAIVYPALGFCQFSNRAMFVSASEITVSPFAHELSALLLYSQFSKCKSAPRQKRVADNSETALELEGRPF